MCEFPFQVMLYILFAIPFMETSMQLLGWVFVGAKPEHSCNGTVSDDHFKNDTEAMVQSSAAIEWNLICERAGLHATIGAAPMGGYIIGGIIFGALSDKLGRKPTFLISNFILLSAGIGCALAPNYWSFAICRLIVGATIAGVEASCFVMGMELVGPSKRTLAGILNWFFETAGLILAVAIAYAVQNNWRLLQALYTLPALLLYYAWAPPESVRWLLSHGKIDVAER